jgi:hypothetical protein
MNGRRRWIEAMAGGVNFRGSFLLIITQRLAAHTHTHTHTHWLIYFDSCNTHKKEKKKKKRVIII